MANTKLTEIIDLMLTLIPVDYKTEAINEQDIAKLAVINFSILTNQNLDFEDDSGVISINKSLTIKEQYYVALLSYKFYLTRLKDEFNRGAINFKTITFEVKSLEERAKQVEYTLRSIDKEIKDTFNSISQNNDFGDNLPIILEEFGSDWQ